MDRLSRGIVVCGFGLLITAGGCRSTRTEVPPGKPFSNEGKPRKAIEFSTDPHPVDGSSTANIMPYNLGGSNVNSSMGRPNPSAYSVPPGGYGPPGTSGMSTTQGSNDSPASAPPAGAPPMPDMSVPRSEPSAPNPMMPPPADKPAMGSPDQMPNTY